ncbi:MAG: sigma-54 interaction domain-containing protein [Bacillota bacterium]
MAIAEAIPIGLHIIDSSGVTIAYNSAAARLDGIEAHEALGQHILNLFPSLTPATSRLLHAVKTGKAVPQSQQTYMNNRGRVVSVINSVYPLVVGGKVVGAFELMNDVGSLAETAHRLVSLAQSQASARAGSDSEASASALCSFDDIVTNHPKMLTAIELARRAAPLDCAILVYGETGTGKEMIVQAIHEASGHPGPLVEQNCAALPETLLESILFGTVAGAYTGARDRPGLLELARDGTLYLDEINSMPKELQAKLLRALQDKYVRRVGDTKKRPTSFRVIASINVDPWEAIHAGHLRADLFYRLSSVLIELPPLREREGDLELLVNHFVTQLSARFRKHVKGLSGEVWAAFRNHHWPGNVRELQHVLEHAMVMVSGDLITLDVLPDYISRRHGQPQKPKQSMQPASTGSLRAVVEELERETIVAALERCSNNVSRAARELGLPRQTLQSKLRRLGIRRQVARR